MKKPRRQLTNEEEELWRVVVTTVTPLEARGLAAKPLLTQEAFTEILNSDPPAPAREPRMMRTSKSRQAQPERRGSAGAQDARIPLAPVMPKRVNPESAYQMNGGWERKLRRGTVEIEDRLDLHGMTREAAFSVLHRFLLNAIGARKRCLLVITGKGGRARGEDGALKPVVGVLKSEVPRWLYHGPLAEHILSVEAAHPRDGGGGAYYVILRRQRQNA